MASYNDDDYELARILLSLSQSNVCGLDNSNEEKEDDSKKEENHQNYEQPSVGHSDLCSLKTSEKNEEKDEQEKNLQAEIKPSVREMELQLYMNSLRKSVVQYPEEKTINESFQTSLVRYVSGWLGFIEKELKNNDSKKIEETEFKFKKIEMLSMAISCGGDDELNSSKTCKTLRKRIKKCRKYFQKLRLNNNMTTNTGTEQDQFYKQIPNQDDLEMFNDIEETPQQLMNKETHGVHFDNITQKNNTCDSSEAIKINSLLEFDFAGSIRKIVGPKEKDLVDIEKNQNKLGECSDGHIEGFDSVIDDYCNIDIEDSNNMEGNLELNHENQFEENLNYERTVNNDNDVEVIELKQKDIYEVLDFNLDHIKKTINLIHECYGNRELEINTFKNNTLDMASYNDLKYNILSNMKHECQKTMDIINNELLLLIRSEIHVKDLKMFVLFGLFDLKANEKSILVISNLNMESVERIRFKVNQENHKFETYFETFFKFVERNFQFDVKLLQTYMFEQREVLCFVKHAPKLLNDNIYSPNDMDHLKLLLMNAYHFYTQLNKLENITSDDPETKELNIDLSNTTLQMSLHVQKSNETKMVPKQVKIQHNESIQFCSTEELSNNSNTFLDNVAHVENSSSDNKEETKNKRYCLCSVFNSKLNVLDQYD